jgi:hypothetical protein
MRDLKQQIRQCIYIVHAVTEQLEDNIITVLSRTKYNHKKWNEFHQDILFSAVKRALPVLCNTQPYTGTFIILNIYQLGGKVHCFLQ